MKNLFVKEFLIILNYCGIRCLDMGLVSRYYFANS